MGYVYLIRCGDLLKVGWTENLPQRFKAYKQHNPDARLECWLTTDDPATEIEMCEILQQFCKERVSREWFRFSPEDIEKAVASIREWMTEKLEFVSLKDGTKILKSPHEQGARELNKLVEGGALVCPECGLEYVHIPAVTVVAGDFAVRVTNNRAVQFPAKNNTRGFYISLAFWCEDGHSGRIILNFHEGITYAYYVPADGELYESDIWRD